ncbi:MAG: hypothetical protein H7Y37_00495, partial [Anaerolineae bacterium]|nr:hypothetical protein [Gloeobacterales cyanobacterium ES-bin-313]
MTDPDRLEKALPDLLRRSGWTEPEAQIPPEPVPLEEQQRWEQLFEEPVEPVRRRFGGLSLLGASGLVAAALIAAVSFRTVLQSSQFKTAPSETAPQKPIDKGYTAMRPKAKKQVQPDFSLPEEKIQQQPVLPTQPAAKSSSSAGRGLPEPTRSVEAPKPAPVSEESGVKKSADAFQDEEEVLVKRRADEKESIANRAETKNDKASSTTKSEKIFTVSKDSITATGASTVNSAPASVPPAPVAGAVSQSSSRLFLVSAPSLDTAALDRFQQQLTRTRIQSTMAGEVVFELK